MANNWVSIRLTEGCFHHIKEPKLQYFRKYSATVSVTNTKNNCVSIYFVAFDSRILLQKKAVDNVDGFFNEINPCGFVKYCFAM